MLSQILKVKDKVEYLLENYPVFRDNDNKLIAKIWWSETKVSNLETFFRDFGDNKHTSPEAIRRARQKLQELNPSLRGKLYADRHKEKKVVTQNINNVTSKKTV